MSDLQTQPPSLQPSPVLPYATGPGFDWGTKPYTPARMLAIWAMALLAAVAVAHVAETVSYAAQTRLLESVKAGTPISPAQAQANDDRVRMLGVVQVGLVIATAVIFTMWLFRVYRNLPALTGRRSEMTPGSAAGSFYIPFVNLVRPYQAVKEVWLGSDPAGRTGTGAVIAWWVLWLGSNIFSSVATRLGAEPSAAAGSPPDLDALITHSQMLGAAGVPVVIAAVAAIYVVYEIDRRQRAKAGR